MTTSFQAKHFQGVKGERILFIFLYHLCLGIYHVALGTRAMILTDAVMQLTLVLLRGQRGHKEVCRPMREEGRGRDSSQMATLWEG